MTHPSADLYLRGLDRFEEVAEQLSTEQWDQASACEGWTNLDVLGHLGNSVRMGAAYLRGEQPVAPAFDRPADLVDGAPLDFWRPLAAAAREAFAAMRRGGGGEEQLATTAGQTGRIAAAGADLDLEMDTPMGRRTVADRLAFPAIDLWVHAWDIGHPIGIDLEIPAEVDQFSHRYIDPFPPEMLRGPQGAFGPEVEVPTDATATERFVAWTGRDPRA